MLYLQILMLDPPSWPRMLVPPLCIKEQLLHVHTSSSNGITNTNSFQLRLLDYKKWHYGKSSIVVHSGALVGKLKVKDIASSIVVLIHQCALLAHLVLSEFVLAKEPVNNTAHFGVNFGWRIDLVLFNRAKCAILLDHQCNVHIERFLEGKQGLEGIQIALDDQPVGGLCAEREKEKLQEVRVRVNEIFEEIFFL